MDRDTEELLALATRIRAHHGRDKYDELIEILRDLADAGEEATALLANGSPLAAAMLLPRAAPVPVPARSRDSH